MRNWRKSSRSQGESGCVETAEAPGHIGVRDTKLGAASPVLSFETRAWRAVIEAVKEDRVSRG